MAHHGHYRCRLSRLMLFLVRLGLARGVLKRYFVKSWIACRGNRPIDIRYHGLKLRLNPSDNTIESKLLFSSQLREKTELSYLNNAIAHGGAVIDIGANMGYYSLMAAHMGAQKVLAIEPNPTMVDRLRQAITMNGFEDVITTYPVGVADAHARIALHICAKDHGSSSLVNDKVGQATIEIDVIPLAYLLEQADISRVSTLKIDVEGAEDRVLIPFFRNCPKSLWPALLIIEDNSDAWKENLLEQMTNYGYQLAQATNANLIYTRNTQQAT